VNEIGQIFWSAGPDSVTAEKKLVEIANAGLAGIHWVAYKYLSDERGPERSPEAIAAVHAYEQRDRKAV
jgi:hypothetical protein